MLHPCVVVTSGTGIRKVVSPARELAMDGQDIFVASVDENDVCVGAARAPVDRVTTCNLTQGTRTRTRTTAAPAWVKKDTGGKAATAVRLPSCVMSLRDWTTSQLAHAFVLGAIIDGAVDAERQR